MKIQPTLVALAAALLGACAQIPDLPKPAQPLQGQQLGLSEAAGPAFDSHWWSAFNDGQLDALIARALAESPSLALVQARMNKAAAFVEAAGAADKPVLGVGFDGTRQQFTKHGLVPPPIAGTIRTTATLQAGVSYEWDFFGKHAAALNAALGQQKASSADMAAARLSLSAQVSRAYLALARVQAQAELVDKMLGERQAALALVRQRNEAGLDTAQELRNAELPLPELRRQRLVLNEQATVLRHQLAALTVQAPQALDSLNAKLPAAQAWPSEVAPALDLLGRRPDLVAARWRVEAATQTVREARAQFFPNVTLSAFAGFSSIGLDNLINAGSRQYGFGPSLRLPLFDTGRLRAQLKGNAAEADAAVAAYNAALVEAVRDASDQYTGLQSLRAQSGEQNEALEQSRRLLELAQQRRQAGLGSQLAVHNAQLGLLQQQRQLLDLRAQSLEGQVGLIRALGGGWNENTTN
ncbi:efflux transporter outer membrane subunit [Pelomonas sp. SE-A7]|uniref:efflux transporter outer membrane subunit n=1 Tax=Pelomonas sp. SE-A7 TaxID=3054953 RepID=UPI00259C71B0|nr:efflux transporter outer membrane subunit [Pelomonas sp. SE-A7]MDM4765133.1 efflux transporter outer membrane subunit [Pelomonas sp. SE-A7]